MGKASRDRSSPRYSIMAVLPDGFTYAQWNAVYNALSFGIAGMGSATIFYWLQLPNLTKNYRSALIITGLVTGIATYHYVRIFNSWVDAFVLKQDGATYTVTLSGNPFNDAYRYVDWLLTVPLLLIELILVMKLPADETSRLSTNLGIASAVMVALGYPGGHAPCCPSSMSFFRSWLASAKPLTGNLNQQKDSWRKPVTSLFSHG